MKGEAAKAVQSITPPGGYIAASQNSARLTNSPATAYEDPIREQRIGRKITGGKGWPAIRNSTRKYDASIGSG